MNSRFRLSRIESFLAAGWPIAPGAWWDERDLSYRCGRFDCCHRIRGLHPVGGELRPVPEAKPWQRSPATVLLLTGLGIDVLEVDLRTVAVEPVLAELSRSGPVALLDVALPRLLLPVTAPAAATLPVGSVGGFARRTGVAGVGLHGAGSWVALPPARVRGGATRWVTSPRAVDWVLPELASVLDVLRAGAAGRDLQPVLATGTTAWGRRFTRGGVS